MSAKRRTRGRRNASLPKFLVARLDPLRARLREQEVDALLVSNAVDIRYLTGFVGDDSWALVPARGRAVTILSDRRFEEQVATEAPWCRAVMRKRSLIDELEKLGRQKKLRTLAVQGAYLNVDTFNRIRKQLTGVTLRAIDDGLLMQRSVKDARETRAIRAALEIHQQAMRNTLGRVRPGMTEKQIAAMLEYEMRSLGADGVSFPTIVAAGANASLPHAVPGDAKVQRNGAFLIDCGVKLDGYCSDLTRVYALGKMPKMIREIYKVTLDAQRAAIDAIAPGRLLRDVDKVARDIITAAGYGEQFGHSLGHGIGLNIHEQPVLATRAEGELAPGQIVTVEPGIYLPGVGGVRIEDDVLVTARGRSVLSDLPTDLESAMIA